MNRARFQQYVPRTVRDLDSSRDQDSERAAGRLSEFFDDSAIVVLGDPGLGKSDLFQRMATEEDGLYTTVRDFLDLNLDRFCDQTLYLDGLDEVRSGKSDAQEVTGRLRSRLDQLGMPKFRLSCRAADWFGGHDLSSLSRISRSGKLRVLQLEPLSTEDVLELAAEKLEDAHGFIETAQIHGLEELLYNPLTLLLLLGVVQAGSWPESRSQVYEQGVRLLAQELSGAHEQTQLGSFSTDQVLEAARRIGAVYVLSGLSGIALVRGAERPSTPFIGDLFARPEPEVSAALRRRLFTVTNERLEPIHRTVAEYLGAEYVIAKIREGLPVNRALSLLQGRDGGILSDRRGLFAWMVTLAAEHLRPFLALDPLAIVLYGDPAILTTQLKIELVKALSSLSEADPLFRAEVWQGQPFGALSSPGTRPLLLEIIEDPSASRHLAITALDTLTFGAASPEIGDRLLVLIRDDSRPSDLRQQCLRAFRHNCPGEKQVLRQLLEDIAFRGLADPQRDLRGELLSALFPQEITPSELPQFLVVDSVEGHFGSSYQLFLHRHVMDRLDEVGVAELLDSLAESALCMDLSPRPGFRFRDFLGRVITEGLRRLGETVAMPRLEKWLTIPVSRSGSNIVEDPHRSEIRQWFADHGEVLTKLYTDTIQRASTEHLVEADVRFWFGLTVRQPPDGFGHSLVEMADREPSDARAAFLFRRAWRVAESPGRTKEPTLGEFWNFVERRRERPIFSQVLTEESLVPIRDDHREWKSEERRAADEEAKTLESIRVDLHDRLDAIRAGRDWGALLHVVELQKGRVRFRGYEPSDAVVAKLYGDDLSAAAHQGLMKAATHGVFPTPDEIGTATARSREYPSGLAMLRGLELLWMHAPAEVGDMTDGALARAVAFNLHFDRPFDDDWLAGAAEDRPGVVASAVKAFWRPLLATKKNSLPGLYVVLNEGTLAPIAKRVAPDILREFPRAKPQILRELLGNALRNGDRDWLRRIAGEELQNYRRLSSEQFLLWLAAGYLLDPKDYREKLIHHAAQSTYRAEKIYSMVTRGLEGSPDPDMAFDLICGLGATSTPEDLQPPSGSVPSPWTVARAVADLIKALSSRSDSKSGALLEKLLIRRNLNPWTERITHALHDHRRARRDAEFRPPSHQAVVETLANGKPANARDLLALLVDHLQSLGQHLRNAAEDGWKLFWSTDRGRPIDPKWENDCRDALKHLLEPRLHGLEAHLETESRHAEQTRADFRAVMFRDGVPLHLPIEVKRHSHPQLWSAIEDQLVAKYLRESRAEGFGIYLVLWFGEHGGSLPRLPDGISPPATAAELESALEMTVPEGYRDRIAVVCLDLSVPERS